MTINNFRLKNIEIMYFIWLRNEMQKLKQKEDMHYISEIKMIKIKRKRKKRKFQALKIIMTKRFYLRNQIYRFLRLKKTF